jgi:phosphoserine phosphatase
MENKALMSQFYGNFQNYGCGFLFREDNMFRRNRRLVCFDMDSTLQTEVIDELADLAGVGEQVSSHYRAAMNEIDFKKALNNAWLC